MSKRYQIYGMGNALVDFEIETSIETLNTHNIDKGIMTLIDEERHHQLYDHFSGQSHTRACGGSAANTILGAQMLGSQNYYSCLVANDETGMFYKQDLLAKGVDSNLNNEALPAGLTGKCLVFITDDADRTMNTFLGITGDISYQQIDESALLNSKFLYVEGYLAGSPIASEGAVETMKFAKDNAIKTAFSLSDPNMVRFCRDGLEAMIGDGVDYLFCNQDEAFDYTSTDNLADAILSLSKKCNTLIITLGSTGSIIVDRGETIEIPGVAVDAIDTNGAGDLFAGSFLHGLCSGLSLAKAGELASFASAQLVTQFGPRLNDDNLVIVKEFAKGL
ncbi:MAG: adenosine kinase [Kangiellaceae bacterium]|nr:adenosine kinase [Kangiellaceae bacterium]